MARSGTNFILLTYLFVIKGYNTILCTEISVCFYIGFIITAHISLPVTVKVTVLSHNPLIVSDHHPS